MFLICFQKLYLLSAFFYVQNKELWNHNPVVLQEKIDHEDGQDKNVMIARNVM